MSDGKKTCLVMLMGMLGVAIIVMLWVSQDVTPTADEHAVEAASPTARPYPDDAVAITIVTNDTKAEWLNLVTDAFNAAKHVTAADHQIHVEMLQEGSPEPTMRKMAAGELQPVLWSPGDISWVEQANRMQADAGRTPLVSEECPRVVYAATGFAMWRPMAEALGWPDTPIGWQEIVDLAADPEGWARYGHPEWGQFTFGHSHPEQSTTGFNMLASLAYAAAGKTSDLTPEDVHGEAVVAAFREMELHTYHYGTSTRGLLTTMAQRGPSYLHAVTASETAVLKTNEVQHDILRFPFVFIFPAEGTFWMDNPACLVDADWVTPEQREAALIYREYLLAAEQQDRAVTIGLRPAVEGVPLHAPISLDDGTDPRVSPHTVPPLANLSADTARAIVDVFKETKKRATVILVLDRSGSMGTGPMNSAKEAVLGFIDRLAPDDRVQVYAFSDQAVPLREIDAVAAARGQLTQAVNEVSALGETALNDAICAAVDAAETERERDREGEPRLYGVVVLTDGRENDSRHRDVFACLPTGEDIDGVKVFTIAYGVSADADLLKRIAERTNGKSFISDTSTVEQVYLAISAEQ